MNLLHLIFLKTFRVTDWSHWSSLDYFYVPFNAFESLCWFACAGFVLYRNLSNERTAREYVYALLFLLFGLSDAVEVFVLCSPLIWAKALILVCLFTVRHQVLRRYDGKYRLL